MATKQKQKEHATGVIGRYTFYNCPYHMHELLKPNTVQCSECSNKISSSFSLCIACARRLKLCQVCKVPKIFES